jgi:hypothetical protein
MCNSKVHQPPTAQAKPPKHRQLCCNPSTYQRDTLPRIFSPFRLFQRAFGPFCLGASEAVALLTAEAAMGGRACVCHSAACGEALTSDAADGRGRCAVGVEGERGRPSAKAVPPAGSAAPPPPAAAMSNVITSNTTAMARHGWHAAAWLQCDTITMQESNFANTCIRRLAFWQRCHVVHVVHVVQELLVCNVAVS